MKYVILSALLTFGFSSAQGAVMIPTQEALATNRATVSEFLARGEVKSKLQALGVSSEEAARRVASLTPDELQNVADRIETMPAGQQDGMYVSMSALIVILLAILLF